jgi:tRNA-intron endonuclease
MGKDVVLVKGKVVVADQAKASKIFNKGQFGAFSDGKLELSLEEALYLMEKKELDVWDRAGRKLSLSGFIKIAEKKQKRFWVRYSVFKNLRSSGYILKTAFKYGGDFRVYEKGAKPGEEHAAWILYAVDEHESIPFLTFAAINRVAHSVKKKLMLGIVDDEGSVTYYEINWVKF